MGIHPVSANQSNASLRIMVKKTYTLNIGARGCEAFHAFCQICIGLLESSDCGVIPSKSIFMSPLVSMGIGWDNVDGGTGIGFTSLCVE
jgi:hypothetical protein